MTDTATAAPSADEILTLWHRQPIQVNQSADAFVVAFAREVLAKWSQPAAVAGPSQWACKSCGCEHGVAGEPYWTHDRTPHPVEAIWRCDKCDATHEIKLVEPTTQAAPQQEPVAWRHSKTLRLYETKAEVPLADGDEWAEPLCLAAQHPAPVAQGDALNEIVGCIDAANAEGLDDALVNNTDARLADLVQRRLLPAFYVAIAADRTQAKEGGAA